MDDKLGGRVDTFTVVDPVTGVEEQNIVETDANLGEVKQYFIKEQWFFDKKHSSMQVRIVGIAPVRIYQHPETGLPYRSATFWVYFPELRDALSSGK